MVDVLVPIVNRVDGDTDVVAKREVKLLDKGLSCGGFDCRMFALYIVAVEEFLKFFAYEFAAVVMSNFGGTRVVAQPVCVELDGTGFGVCCWDQCKFNPVCTCIEHCEDVDFVLAFSMNGILLNSYCQWSCTVDMDFFEGVPVVKGQNYRQKAVVKFSGDFVMLALVT